MKLLSHCRAASMAAFAAAFIASPFAHGQAPVQLDVRDMQNAEALANEGKYDEALKLYDGIPKNYPTSAYIPGANLGAAISQYFLKNYDEAIRAAEENTRLKTPPPPEVLERTYSLIPQIHLAKAVSLEEGTQLRAKAIQDAVKAFDEFVAKFPASDEVEAAILGKGRAQMILGQYETAAETFRANLEKFPKSPSALDSEYMLAFALYLQGAKAMQAQTTADPTIVPAFEESEKLLRNVAGKRSDLALINRSTLLLGDVLKARASITPEEDGARDAMVKNAIAVYRNVAPKDVVVQAQEARIKYFGDLATRAGQTGDMQGYRKNRRQVEKEREKLGEIEAEADQSIAAKIKSGQSFVGLGKFDEARVLMNFVQPFVEDTPEGKEQLKQIAYFITVTYAAQHIADKAVGHYEKFKAAYKADPLGENLPLLMGGVFLDPDPKINDPQKAIAYFDEQVKAFPNSRFAADAAMQKATALIQLQKFDEAAKSLKDFIAGNKDPTLLAAAEFSLAVVHSQTGKNAEAIAAFKAVRDKYPDSEEAQQASFYIGQILYTSGDAAGALNALDAFAAKFPNSELLPQALYFKARSLTALGKKDEALAAYAKVANDYPESEVAVPAYFERAIMLQTDDKLDEAIATMREFTEKFPDAPQVYQAVDFIAQIQTKQKNVEGAIETYEDYIAKHGDNPASAKAYVAIAKLHVKQAGDIGSWLVIAAKDKPAWTAAMEAALKSAEMAIETFPESDTVSVAVQELLDVQQTRQVVGLVPEEKVSEYFTGLAAKYDGTPAKAKISFAYAGFVAGKNPDAAFTTMKSAYDPAQIYAPEDLDLYGKMLIEQKQFEEAGKIADKLEKDYPVPPNTPPEKVTRTIGTAQSIAMSLRAQVLEAQGKAAEGQKILEKLKALYPWSPKVAEADFGIAAGLYEQQKYDEAVEILARVTRDPKGPVPLRAKAMMMIAKAREAQGKYGEAINNFTKISAFFESERELAAEGLWRGGQLQEKQGAGEIPMAAPGGKAAPAGDKPAGRDAKPAKAEKPDGAGK